MNSSYNTLPRYISKIFFTIFSVLLILIQTSLSYANLSDTEEFRIGQIEIEKNKRLSKIQSLKLNEDISLSLQNPSPQELEEEASSASENYLFDRAYKIYSSLLEIYTRKSGADSLDALRIRRHLAETIYAKGDYNKGLSILRKLAEEQKNILGDNNQEYLKSQFSIANMLYFQDAYSQAYDLLATILPVQERTLGLTNEDTLQSIHLRAALERNYSGGYEAQQNFKEYYEVAVKVLDENNILRLRYDALKGLLMTYTDAPRGYYLDKDKLKEYLIRQSEGSKLLRATLKKIEDRFGVLHPLWFEVSDLLAESLVVERYIPYAQKRQEFNTLLLEEVISKEHPMFLVSKAKIANMLMVQGENVKAHELHKEVYEIEKRVLGIENNLTLEIAISIASTYNAMNNFYEAIKLLDEIIPILEKNENEALVGALFVYANAYNRGLTKHKALEAYKKLYPLLLRDHGPDDEFTKRLTFQIKALERELVTKMADKEESLYISLQDAEEKLGKNDYATLGLRLQYAFLLMREEKIKEAIVQYEQAYEGYKVVYGKDHSQTLEVALHLAKAYYALGSNVILEELLLDVIPYFKQTLGERNATFLEAQRLFFQVQMRKGNYIYALQQAQESYDRLKATKGVNDTNTIFRLHDLASIYVDLGDYVQAEKVIVENFPQYLLEMTLFVPEFTDLYITLSNIYKELGREEKANALLNQIMLNISDKSNLNNLEKQNISRIQLKLLQQTGNITESYELAKTIFFTNLDLQGEFHTQTIVDLDTFINLATEVKKFDDELDFPGLLISLSLIHDPLESLKVLNTLNTVIKYYSASESYEIAVLLGKIAILSAREQRNRNEGLDRELQQVYLEKTQGLYHQVIQDLMSLKRHKEAFYILALLKEAELDDNSRSKLYQKEIYSDFFTEFELRVYKNLKSISEICYEAGQKYIELTSRQETLSDIETETLETYTEILTDNSKLLSQLLYHTDDILKMQSKVPNDTVANKNLKAVQNVIPNNEKVSLVHTLTTEENTYIFLTTPTKLLTYIIPIKKDDLHALILDFRAKITNPQADPRPLGKQLYNLLIKPIEKDLQNNQTKLIAFSLDGALRYIPMGPLYDGEKWLIEQYDIALFTEAARESLSEFDQEKKEIAALGLTEAVDGYSALPAVEEEINNIVLEKNIGILKGKKFLNDDFSQINLEDVLQEKTPLVHIASHFIFDSIQQTNSFLLLGGGNKLTLEKMFFSDEKFSFDNIDLLTLSACDTAVGVKKGDGREIESFAALAQKQGANTILASLWPVVDSSTAALMQEFYAKYSLDSLNKASALAQAQRLFINGQLTEKNTHTERNKRGKLISISSSSPEWKAEEDMESWSHPYFWSPFILMGNWN